MRSGLRVAGGGWRVAGEGSLVMSEGCRVPGRQGLDSHTVVVDNLKKRYIGPISEDRSSADSARQRRRRGEAERSELFHVGPEVEFQGPGRLILFDEMPVGGGDGIWIEKRLLVAVRKRLAVAGS